MCYYYNIKFYEVAVQGNIIRNVFFLNLSITNFQLCQMKRTAVFEWSEQSATLGAPRLILHCSLSVPCPTEGLL